MHIDLEGLDKKHVYELLEANDRQQLYKELLLAVCNDMGNYLPGMFTRISDYKVLLFPDNLLNSDSILGKMILDIDEDDWCEQVEIIGWMYQYYISEKHEEVIDPLHGKMIKKEDIPAATQLWTTDWVVRYMVDNSLGRYWIERNPKSPLKKKLLYLATSKTNEIPVIYEKVNPQDITFFDPCMGSGHILVYAFDVLMEIYKECGYSERDAALSIVKNNLYGLDIDDRAYQLSYFAVMMKARNYNRKALTSGIVNHLASIQESNLISQFTYEGIAGDKDLNQLGEYLVHIFKDAKEIGSLTIVKEADYKSFDEYLNKLKNAYMENIFASHWQLNTLPLMEELSKQAQILSKKYTVCATNPPYMNRFEISLKNFINENYKDYSSDLFSVFMYRNFNFCIESGYSAFMTPNVWMFIKSYEKLRKFILNYKNITTLVQMAKGAFFKEATVDICAFIIKNKKSNDAGLYFRLEDFKGDMEVQKQKVLEAQTNKECGYFYESNSSNFSKIPGSPIAYWVGFKLFEVFENGILLGEVADSKQGIATANNNRFLRGWFEVSLENIKFDAKSKEEAKESNKKWFPYNKGGGFRKWYGNNDYVINWENDGYEVKHFYGKNGKQRSAIRNPQYFFKESFTWSDITSNASTFRYKSYGFLFDVSGMSVFSSEKIFYLLGLCNTKVVYTILKIIAPTIHCQCGDVANIPIFYDKDRQVYIENLVRKNIDLSKSDWDSFETSWDFIKHPLIEYAAFTPQDIQKEQNNGFNPLNTLEDAYKHWERACNERFNQLKANEEELNRIFIDIYGLNDELDPYVEDKDVTVRKADLGRDIRSFISYAVGCMFGRYSLDVEGLIYAGGNFDDKYCRWISQFGDEINNKIDEHGVLKDGGWTGFTLCEYDGIRKDNQWKKATFSPGTDNIIPICDDVYFDDDIVGRFVRFVETVYGKDSLEENLTFIADALGGKGTTSRAVIRNYFLNEFYKDHCKIYQKRPIYWLFDSGKKNGFKALIYMHRYQPDLIARMRTQYVFEQQARYRNQIELITKQLDDEISSSERIRLNKKLKTLKEQDEELRKYEEVVHHYADQMIEIDLDDGVKVNYEKFKDLLAKIK